MKFPDKFDVLAVHASLISETGGSAGLRMKAYSSLLSPQPRTATIMKPPIW